jgi:hypothetical protein
MITTAVLALGATLIYQSFFIALDSYSYYAILLKTTPWMDEKIWETQNDLRRLGQAAATSDGGQLNIDGRDINWGLTCNSVGQEEGLYQVNLVLSWLQGSRQVKLSRSAYAIYAKK